MFMNCQNTALSGMQRVYLSGFKRQNAGLQIHYQSIRGVVTNEKNENFRIVTLFCSDFMRSAYVSQCR